MNSVAGSWINGPNIQIGSAGNVTLALGRPDYQVQWLQPTPRDGRVPRRQRTPSYLLDARREVVPFWPRPDIQNVLLRWRDDRDDPASVLLLHGPGGQGKTRLANAFAGLCHESGWAVARAVSPVDSPGDVLPDAPHSVDGEAPVLVVVDYAERWPVNTLAELIRSLVLDFSDRVLRVLLLARSRGQVWQALGPLVGRHIDVLDPVELGTITSREEMFAQAVEAFGQALERPPVTETPDLSHDDYGSVLMLHMAALAAVYQSSPHHADLSTYLLEHEKRHWPLTGPTSEGVTLSQVADSVFLATLFGPFQGVDDATATLAAAGIADARAVLRWHDTLYPQDPSGGVYPALAPLRPDRFGEDFVAQHLGADPRCVELLRRILGRELLNEDAVRRCLIVLAAVADRNESTRATLWSLLDDRRVAAHVSASVIQTAIDHAPLATCRAIEEAMPDYRIDLHQAAAALTVHVVDTLPSTTSRATRAWYLNTLGIRLSDAGDYQAALEVVREAVEHWRALVAVDPVHQSGLAASLTILGIQLSAVGGEQQAALELMREAVAIRRVLVKVDPDAHLPKLAASLNSLGSQLERIGESQTAIGAGREAVEHWRALVAVDPVHQFALAVSLNNLSDYMGATGKVQAALELAREAVAMHRVLVKVDPDAHLPSLAGSLSNLSVQLTRGGDRRAALESSREAMVFHRALAEVDPAAYLPDLAKSMWTIACTQVNGAGQRSDALEEALDAAESACRIYEELARRWPEGFESEKWHARATRAEVLKQLGRTP